jgi:hypothetical protein|nr:MAG TPA: hypothetical protein [Caudoviricetes sp.]
MKRLTSEEVRVDESVDRYLGPLADLEGMKPKLLDLILNGPVLNGVSKDVLRQIIRQLYSALAAYEDTGITAEEITATVSIPMFVKAVSAVLGTTPERLRELAEADKDGRLVVLPCKVGDTVYLIVTKRARNYTSEFRFVKKSRLTFLNMERILQDFGKEAFFTREEAEKALEAMK